MKKPGIYLTVALLLPVFTRAAPPHPWPQFRGPGGDGVASADEVPVRFSESGNLKWKTPIPGKGWSSPVVTSGGSIWVTTAVERSPVDEEDRKKLLSATGETEKKFKSRQIARSITLKALEVELQTGAIQRELELTQIENPDAIHTLNSYASPTPILIHQTLICHFGTFGTFCVNTESGAIVWQKEFPLEHNVGPGSSPAICEGLLILICDGVDQQYLIALDPQSGETVWKKDRPAMRAASGDQKKAYSTPLSVEDSEGRRQLIALGSQWLVSYAPKSGDELWRLDHGKGFSVVPRPVFHEKSGLLFFSTGFGKPELRAVQIDGSGDITGSDKIAWTETRRIPAKPSPLLVDDMVFVISDGGIASCFDAGTGKVHWTERIEGNYSASPIVAGSRIYFCSHEGKVTVIRAGDEFEIVAENLLDGQIMASPIALDGLLLLRTDRALYRVGGAAN